jgi:hypothetical protein
MAARGEGSDRHGDLLETGRQHLNQDSEHDSEHDSLQSVNQQAA